MRLTAPLLMSGVSKKRGTNAVQQNLLMMFQRRLSWVGRIGSHQFLRSVLYGP